MPAVRGLRPATVEAVKSCTGCGARRVGEATSDRRRVLMARWPRSGVGSARTSWRARSARRWPGRWRDAARLNEVLELGIQAPELERAAVGDAGAARTRTGRSRRPAPAAFASASQRRAVPGGRRAGRGGGVQGARPAAHPGRDREPGVPERGGGAAELRGRAGADRRGRRSGPARRGRARPGALGGQPGRDPRRR